MSKLINARILLSFATLIAAAAIVIGATFAFFSDSETSINNTLTAGAIDLKIDNESFYNGVANAGTTWDPGDLPGHLFFDFNDIKPSDFGEDTISLEVQNDAWACMSITKTKDDDNTCTEPELEAGNDPTCTEPDSDTTDGELGGLVNFSFWADDGDNVYESDEIIFKTGTASTLFNGSTWTLADSLSSIWPTPGPLPGNETRYIGKAWCFGPMNSAALLQDDYTGPDDPVNDSVDPTGPATAEDGGFSCDGSNLNNSSQTDSLMGDVNFSAVQARHNASFTCSEVTPSISPSVTPTITITPTPLACTQADVMLVLDRSGSINSTELGQLKTAAKAFVDDLGLTPAGIHAGQSSFATFGSLDHILDSNSLTLKVAIDALVAGGNTNLKAGIDLASAQLSGVNDRIDGTSPDKMIIVTDGNPNRPLPSSTADDVAAASATAFKSGGGEVYVVGVGGDVNTAYLQGVATDAGHYFPASDYSGLQTALQNLDLCAQ